MSRLSQFSRILRFNSSKNVKCFFRNLKRFQTCRLSFRPWAFCEISMFSTLHRRDAPSQLSGYPEKSSSKSPWSIWCLFANAKQFLKGFWSFSTQILRAWAFSNLESRGRLLTYYSPEQPGSLKLVVPFAKCQRKIKNLPTSPVLVPMFIKPF